MSDRVIGGFILPSWPRGSLDLQMVGRTIMTRQGLLELDDRLLEDIGLDRSAALAEVRRAPWDIAPPRPRRRDRPDHGRSIWTALFAALRRYRSRQRIASLDMAMLKDIGVSYAEAEAEANKPFWKA